MSVFSQNAAMLHSWISNVADADQVHFHMIPKPNRTEGLGIGWPAQETDMDKLKELHAALKAKM